VLRVHPSLEVLNVDLKAAAAFIRATMAMVLLCAACRTNETPTTPDPPPTPRTAAFTVTFGENPVPFRSTGCNASIPQGWFTTARLQETGGVSFTPGTLTQKLDGSTAGILAESFDSRFGACAGSAFTQGTIAANGAACAVVGVCTASTFGNYQFELAGTDANGRTMTVVSPLLQFGARPAGQLMPFVDTSLKPMAPRAGSIVGVPRW
jgi:hypothetical protein